MLPYRATQIARAAMEGIPGAVRKIQIVDMLAESEEPEAPLAKIARENLSRALALEERGYVHPLELPEEPCMYDYLREHVPYSGGWYTQGSLNSEVPIPESIGAEKEKPVKVQPWIIRVLAFWIRDLWKKGATETVPAPKVKVPTADILRG